LREGEEEEKRKKNACRLIIRKPEGKCPQGISTVGGRIILKLIF
jgi:hypothetical protein